MSDIVHLCGISVSLLVTLLARESIQREDSKKKCLILQHRNTYSYDLSELAATRIIARKCAS